jgi:hypothetical protein
MKYMKYRNLLILPLLFLLTGCDGSGDRVLVCKFAADTQLVPLRRYDVVVFKFPKTPVENGTPKNYIKRLCGLPGEILAIFFGQLYIFTFGDQLPDALSEEEWRKLQITKDEWHQLTDTSVFKQHLDMWKYGEIRRYDEEQEYDGKRYRLFLDNTATVDKLWKAGQFKILRKPPDVMLALSRPVYDNDHQAADLINVLPPRWAAAHGSAWAADGEHGFQTDRTDQFEQWLHYRHLKRPVEWPKHLDPKSEDYRTRIDEIKSRKHFPQLITDTMGYNSYEVGNHGTPAANWAGDLMLDCNLTVVEPRGQFWLELSRGVDRFQARFDLSTGVCSLFRWSDHKTKKAMQNGFEKQLPDWQPLGTADTRVKNKGTYHIRFANYDERLTVWVDRDLPFESGKEYPAPSKRGPDTEPDLEAVNSGNLDDIKNNDLQPASMCGIGANLRVANIKLWRDTYYTRDPNSPPDASPPVTGDDWKHPSAWGPLRDLTPRMWYIYPGHYMCLGDNSPESSDSRYWGLVPHRLMLGRALVIYFPFDRAGTIK